MLREQYSLWCSVVVAGLTVLAATQVTAIGATTPSPAVAQPPPRACDISVPGGSVNIKAGPNGAGGLADTFPLPQSGDVCAGLGSCLEWQYRFTYSHLTPLKAALAVDTDITVQDCNPDCQVTTHNPLVSKGERTLVFSATSTLFTASYFTPVGVSPGTMTASFVAKKGNVPRQALCALAGADSVVTSTNLAVATQVFDQVGECTIKITKDSQGCAVEIETVSGPCLPADIEDADLTILINATTNEPIAISCNTRVTAPGSSRYCYPTSTGKMKCITVP